MYLFTFKRSINKENIPTLHFEWVFLKYFYRELFLLRKLMQFKNCHSRPALLRNVDKKDRICRCATKGS